MIDRATALDTLQEEALDVLVIGGGVTGAGVALDAASRGYSVGLVERDDFACGTSSRSSKMVHGGLRYLQNFDVALVREALVERRLMVQLAPHLVWPVPFMVPAFGDKRIDRKIGLALNMYSVMQRGRSSSRADRLVRARLSGRSLRQYHRVSEESEWSPERHRVISGEEVLELAPALESRNPHSAYMFYDCQTDDVRLVLTILGEAERYGAVMANRVSVTGLIERDGKTVGAAVTDVMTGSSFEISAKHVVNATGVWAGNLRPETAREQDVPSIRPSRGTHITLNAADLPLVGALVVPAGGDRTIFALPWLGRTLIGTTDSDYEGSLDHVRPGEADVEYLLDAVNNYFELSLTSGDITGAYAGVRPLISSGDSSKSVDISRRAELYEVEGGMITITGGKLTTWRAMAAMVVDRLVARDRREAPCRTEEVPLGLPVEPEDLPVVQGVDTTTRDHLARRYGSAAVEVLLAARADRSLADPIVDGMPDPLAEVVIAARREQAQSIGDVLLRRTRLGLLAARDLTWAGDMPPDSVSRVAQILATELNWDAPRVAAEITAWREIAKVEGLVTT